MRQGNLKPTQIISQIKYFSRDILIYYKSFSCERTQADFNAYFRIGKYFKL